MKAVVEAEKLKAKRFWRLRCEQMLQEDRLQAKDVEITQLCEQLSMADVSPRRTSSTGEVGITPTRTNYARTVVVSGDRSGTMVPQNPPVRRGKTPPIKSINREDTSIHWDDWLPTLKRAAT